MRIIGELVHWNESKAYGFLKPKDNSKQIFVHLSAFPAGIVPEVGMVVSYEVETRDDGRTRAVNLDLVE